MSEETKNILDLCRLNLMEENVEKSCAIDKDTTLKAIDYAKRRAVGRITPSIAANDAMEKHVARNLPEGLE